MLKEPWLATFLSKLYPGLGQCYAGNKSKGAGFIVLQTGIFCLTLYALEKFIFGASLKPLLLIGAFSTVFWLYNLFNAHFEAEQFNQRNNINLPYRPKQPYLAMFLSLIFPGLGQLYNGQIFKGIAYLTAIGVTNFILNKQERSLSRLVVQNMIVIALQFWTIYDAYCVSATANEGKENNLIDAWGTKKVATFAGIYALALIGMIPAASYVATNVLQAYKIPSRTMQPTLNEGDHVFVNKLYYKKYAPKDGDLAVFLYPATNRNNPHFDKDFIKRIIATEGQVVQIKDKKLFVDNMPVDEPYAIHTDMKIYSASMLAPDAISAAGFQNDWETRKFESYEGNGNRDNFGPVTVPKGNVFTMGDNRDRSFDSRFYGPVPMDNIKGRAFLIYFPFHRWRRFS